MNRQKFASILMAVLVAVLFFAITGMGGSSGVPRMTKDALKAEMNNPDVVIVDVRAAGDWKSSEWKITGAVREDPTDVESWQKKYSKNKTIVLYCA